MDHARVDRQVIVEGYDDDPAPEQIHDVIAAFLSLGPDALHAASPHLFAYYQDIAALIDDEDLPAIAGPADVLDHVTMGDECYVQRDDDGHVYVAVEGNCDWEVEHGVQVVFRDGVTVSKVGPFDGHLTNVHAFADPSLAGVVYRPLR